jgi:DNA polymerase
MGEAPGEQEDRQGKTFVGPSGKLLRRHIPDLRFWENKLRWSNTIRCRPLGNRDPEQIETECCRPCTVERNCDALSVVIARLDRATQ